MKFRGSQWLKRSHLEMFLPIFLPIAWHKWDIGAARWVVRL